VSVCNGERRSEVLLFFMDSGRRGREKIMKKEDKNFVKKGEIGKKDENDCARILTTDLISSKSKLSGPRE